MLIADRVGEGTYADLTAVRAAEVELGSLFCSEECLDARAVRVALLRESESDSDRGFSIDISSKQVNMRGNHVALVKRLRTRHG